MYKEGKNVKNLSKNEERFRDIILSTSDWFWEINTQGEYVFVSGRIEKILGYSEKEVIGKTFFDFMEEEEKEKIREIFKNIIGRKEAIKDVENWNINKNGERILLLTSGVPILGKNKELLGYRGVDKDITEQRKNESKLKSLEIKLQSMLIYSPHFIVTVDKFGRVISINHTTSNLTLKEVIGTSVYDYIPKEQHKIYSQYLDRVFRMGKLLKTEFKSRASRWHSIRFIPIKDYKKVNSVIIIANDMTEEKIYKEENRELKNKIKNLENKLKTR